MANPNPTGAHYYRPYHGMLLLEEPSDVIEALPLDASPSLVRLLKVLLVLVITVIVIT